MQTVALIGMRGVGKSTYGPILARELGLGFFDLDQHLSPSLHAHQILRLQGEAKLRELEFLALQRVSRQGLIVACGGGVVTSRPSLLTLKRFFTVWLRATPEQLLGRRKGENRPRLNGASSVAEEIAMHTTSREPLYSKAADLVYDVSDIDPGADAVRLTKVLLEAHA